MDRVGVKEVSAINNGIEAEYENTICVDYCIRKIIIYFSLN